MKHEVKNGLFLSLGSLLLVAGEVRGQRMGHSNTNAPEITQIFRVGDKVNMKLSYAAITWASGTWSKALQDPKLRVGMRDRINGAAKSDPLGAFESSSMVKIAGKSVPRGRYALAFMLSEQFTWQLVLTGKKKIVIDLEFEDAKRECKRLTMNLDGGEANFTGSLRVLFGAQQCAMDVVPLVRKAGKVPGILNTMCPLMDEAIDPEITVSYGGKKIGMCCEDCVDDWKKLSKAEKEAHFKKMLAK